MIESGRAARALEVLDEVLRDPVLDRAGGFTNSSLAKIRTAGFGDIRGISTSGVWPIASRMSS